MTLACGFLSLDPSTIVMTWVTLALPVLLFAFLPKLLPLRRELRWRKAFALRPLAALASRLEGNRTEARSWGERLKHAFQDELRAEHPVGRSGAVVRDTRLLGRALSVGRIAVGLVAGVSVLVGIGCYSVRSWSLEVGAALALVAAAAGWSAWIAGSAAGLWAQAMALGRGTFARLGAGVLVALGYGIAAGATAALSVATAGAMFVGLYYGSNPLSALAQVIPIAAVTIAGAIFGALLLLVLVVPVALATRPETEIDQADQARP